MILAKELSDACLPLQNQENLDLVERFRTARSDVQEREQRLQQVEEFIGSVRLELISSETERQHLREALGRKVQEIQQVKPQFNHPSFSGALLEGHGNVGSPSWETLGMMQGPPPTPADTKLFCLCLSSTCRNYTHIRHKSHR